MSSSGTRASIEENVLSECNVTGLIILRNGRTEQNIPWHYFLERNSFLPSLTQLKKVSLIYHMAFMNDKHD